MISARPVAASLSQSSPGNAGRFGFTAKTLLLVLTLLAHPGCQDPPQSPSTQDAAPFTVCTVSYPLAYFAERIGGDAIEVSFPAPANVDPAYWQPSGDVVARYQVADLLLLNGAGYARWVATAPLPRSRLLDTGSNPSRPYMALADNVSHTHGTGGEHSHGELAVTTWLDLDLAAGQVRAITEALVAALPDQAASLSARAATLLDELATLDGRLLDLGPAPAMLASHPVYQYLARRYELDLRAVHWEPHLAPSAEQWATLDELLAERPARWMVWEGPPLPEVRAELQRRGVSVVVFEPCGNRPPQDDFLVVMERNIEELALAFEG